MPLPLTFARRLRCSDDPSKIALGGAEGEQRADQEVEGYGGIAGFHLGDARLAGAQSLRQIDLNLPRILLVVALTLLTNLDSHF